MRREPRSSQIFWPLLKKIAPPLPPAPILTHPTPGRRHVWDRSILRSMRSTSTLDRFMCQVSRLSAVLWACVSYVSHKDGHTSSVSVCFRRARAACARCSCIYVPARSTRNVMPVAQSCFSNDCAEHLRRTSAQRPRRDGGGGCGAGWRCYLALSRSRTSASTRASAPWRQRRLAETSVASLRSLEL